MPTDKQDSRGHMVLASQLNATWEEGIAPKEPTLYLARGSRLEGCRLWGVRVIVEPGTPDEPIRIVGNLFQGLRGRDHLRLAFVIWWRSVKTWSVRLRWQWIRLRGRLAR